ncbi:hypothetical protein [Agrobacterium cavarae]|uniref:hypothetical protein n=1 Tax=Agrobacterium cavarae TaxID=2528239 RepID=UPI0028A0E3B2|nr:hypothetical protein [Agrobacterium cavarae]
MIAFFTGTLIGRSLAVLLALLAAFGVFRVWLSHHDATLLSGYVLLSEKTAAEAKAIEMERQRNAAAQVIEENRKRALADTLMEQQREAELDKAIKDDNSNTEDGDYRWDGVRDLEWLCAHGSKAPDCRR